MFYRGIGKPVQDEDIGRWAGDGRGGAWLAWEAAGGAGQRGEVIK